MSLIANIDDIRNISIADVVGKYVTLRRAGVRQVANCPFHTEKSPSFGVHPAKNIFKCFGCGAAGDGIEFVMRHEHLTFYEAVERIASDHQVRLEIDRNGDYDGEKAKQEAARKERESLHLLQEWATKTYFDHNFGSIEWGRVSIDGRPVSWHTIKAFEISYTGDDHLIRKMSAVESWGMEALLATHLLKEGQNNSGTYDGFYRRILFPIRDQRGKVAGFGGRILKEDQQNPHNKRPKYYNSPESAVYQKQDLLYGLWQNRKAIGAERADYSRNEGFAYIVEGYMDVVTMYDFGIQNAVAPCGTALTDQQIDLLSKYTEEVVLCFDSDKAGEAATVRSIERLLQKGFKVQILFLRGGFDNAGRPEKHDPDSFLRKLGLSSPRYKRTKVKEGKDTHIAVVQTSDLGWAGAMKKDLMDAIEWMTLKDFKPEDPHSRAEAIQTAARLLGHVDSEILKNRYIENLCQKGYLGNVKRELRDAIALTRDEFLRRNRYKFTHEQEKDRLRYGIYIDAKKFWQAIGDGEGWELTNFIVDPLMCVIGSNKSLRLVRITNEDEVAGVDTIVHGEEGYALETV